MEGARRSCERTGRWLGLTTGNGIAMMGCRAGPMPAGAAGSSPNWRLGRAMILRSALAVVLVAGVVSMAVRPAGAAQSQQVEVRSGIQYTVAAGQVQLLDAYVPAGDGPFAAVILIHGGGWEHGERANLADEARYLATNGFVAFTIDYRRAFRQGAHYNPYPAAV